MGELLAVVALVMFSANIIVTKLASRRVEVSLGLLVALVVNVACATLIVAARVPLLGDGFSVNITALTLFALAGFFSTYLGRWLLYSSVVSMGPSRASAFQSSNPMFTVLMAWLLLGERLSGVDLVASLVIITGLFFSGQRLREPSSGPETSTRPTERIPAEDDGGAGRRTVRAAVSSGGSLALLGAFSYAVGNILRGVAVESWNVPVLGVLLGALTGLAAYSIFGFATRDVRQRIRGADRAGLSLFALGGVLTVLAQACMIGAMSYTLVSTVTLVTLSTPILVLPLGYFVLKNEEGILPRTVFGAVAVLAGVTAIVVF